MNEKKPIESKTTVKGFQFHTVVFIVVRSA